MAQVKLDENPDKMIQDSRYYVVSEAVPEFKEYIGTVVMRQAGLYYRLEDGRSMSEAAFRFRPIRPGSLISIEV